MNIVVSDHPSVGLLIDYKKSSSAAALNQSFSSIEDQRSSSSETRPGRDDAATIPKFSNLLVSKASGIGAKTRLGTRRSLDEETKLVLTFLNFERRSSMKSTFFFVLDEGAVNFERSQTNGIGDHAVRRSRRIAQIEGTKKQIGGTDEKMHFDWYF